jgi:predicted Zn-dependent protease
VYEVAVANTAGTARYATGTTASVRVFAIDPSGISGFAQRADRDISRLDVAARGREACEKSVAGRDPVTLPAGAYDVLLEPPAVVELLEWLAFIAFGGREVQDGTSPLAGRQGQRITGEGITVVDDGVAPDGFGVPFDRDGVVRRRVVLIDRGLAGTPVFDRLHGKRAGTTSTGHAAQPGGFDDAPIAQCIRMDGGSAQREQLLGSIRRGLWISRLHYVNGFLEPRRAMMTGLTRDGTFLLEDGVRTRGVRNMRFTDAILEALGRCDGITSDTEAVPTWWSEAGAFVAPAILIRGLRFSHGGVDRVG